MIWFHGRGAQWAPPEGEQVQCSGKSSETNTLGPASMRERRDPVAQEKDVKRWLGESPDTSESDVCEETFTHQIQRFQRDLKVCLAWPPWADWITVTNEAWPRPFWHVKTHLCSTYDIRTQTSIPDTGFEPQFWMPNIVWNPNARLKTLTYLFPPSFCSTAGCKHKFRTITLSWNHIWLQILSIKTLILVWNF